VKFCLGLSIKRHYRYLGLRGPNQFDEIQFSKTDLKYDENWGMTRSNLLSIRRNLASDF
jgi:hypothetical protein